MNSMHLIFLSKQSIPSTSTGAFAQRTCGIHREPLIPTLLMQEVGTGKRTQLIALLKIAQTNDALWESLNGPQQLWPGAENERCCGGAHAC
jgi:hypothetical protein